MKALIKVAALAAVLCAPAAFAQDYPNSQTSPSSSKQTAPSADYTKRARVKGKVRVVA